MIVWKFFSGKLWLSKTYPEVIDYYFFERTASIAEIYVSRIIVCPRF
jgi:hypothetical protein